MSLESLEKSKRAEQESALQKDFEANRCTILTELHGDKWRIHAFGPKLREGKPDLAAIAIEFETLEKMLAALPGVAAGFYNVVPPQPDLKQN